MTYHPDYGYPQSKRDAAMKDAETIGIITSAAVHNVSLSALYKWIREARINDRPHRRTEWRQG